MNPFDPMPTIKSILGMTMAQDIEQSIMLAQLDDFEVPKCEGYGHGDPTAPNHSGPAAFLLVVPCHCFDGYRCKPFIDWVMTPSDIYCPMCDSHYEPSDITVLPIGGQK